MAINNPEKQKHVLLERLMREEITSDLRMMILGEMLRRRSTVEIRKFEFNCFDVTLDFSAEVVTTQDVLDVSDEGELSISLDEFVQALNATA